MTDKTTKTTLWIAAMLLIVGAGAAARFFLTSETPSAVATKPLTATPSAASPDQHGPLPSFQLVDLDGHSRDITEWQGKVVVLNFWATWCPPCRRELPTFKALQDQYGPKGVQFVGISLDRGELVRDFTRSDPLNYPQLVGPNKALKLSQMLGNQVGALPFTVVVDRHGRIVTRVFGEWNRDEAIATFERLL